jgi:steroid delta-isomerase-like uncharacterized protein
MADDHKAIIRAFIAGLNEGDLSVIDRYMAPEFADHDPGRAGLPPGIEGFKQFFAAMKQAFPDTMVIPEDMVAEGDKVAVRFTVRGTHRGEFMGIAPMGKEVVVQGMDINRMANGKIAERWGIADSLSMLQQLGVIPSSR